MEPATGDYPRWLDRLVAVMIWTLIALHLFAPAAYPQQFKPQTDATADVPGYLGITSRSCSVEAVMDSLGNLNGFRLRAKIIYASPDRPEWVSVIGMYRPEDEKKAHLDCLRWHKQTFEKIWDAKSKARKAVIAVAKLPPKPPLKSPTSAVLRSSQNQ